MLSVLYIVLIALALIELGLVAWTINFLRKYAFRPNPDPVRYARSHAWPRPVAGVQLGGLYRAPRHSPPDRRAANQEAEPSGRPGEANRG